MDNINQKILDVLQKSARISLADLAKQVHLSAPAVAERVRRLEEQNVIHEYVARIDYHQAGYPIEAIVRVRVFSGKEPTFFKFAEARREIIEGYNVTGEYSFIMKVIVQSMRELDAFLEDVSVIAESETNIILSEVTRKVINLSNQG
jgi:Lrp/AsnC family leucine-responsive transcriptional regulator